MNVIYRGGVASGTIAFTGQIKTQENYGLILPDHAASIFGLDSTRFIELN